MENTTLAYVGWTVSYERGVDEDETLLIEVVNSMRAVGYGSTFKVWYKMHNRQLSSGLRPIESDKDVYQVFMVHRYYK